MNYLAHAYLSGDNDYVLVGNMMGDAIKGNGFLEDGFFPTDIIKGIRLHRFIDDFTDNHPLCLEGKKRLWSRYRHYSGVLTDMYYDHILAFYWERYSKHQLSDFAQTVYSTLEDKWEWLPERTQHMVTYMKRYDWLSSYSSIDGISRALGGLSRRTTHKSGLETGANELMAYFDDYEREFHEFFNEIREACAKQLNDYEQT